MIDTSFIIENYYPPEISLSLFKPDSEGNLVVMSDSIIAGYSEIIVSVHVSIANLLQKAHYYQYSRDHVLGQVRIPCACRLRQAEKGGQGSRIPRQGHRASQRGRLLGLRS